jgi:hypothetical protein
VDYVGSHHIVDDWIGGRARNKNWPLQLLIYLNVMEMHFHIKNDFMCNGDIFICH